MPTMNWETFEDYYPESYNTDEGEEELSYEILDFEIETERSEGW